MFRLLDPEQRLAGVRLWQELGIPADQLDFAAVDGGWALRLPRPYTHRMEYLFECCDHAGQRTSRTDPTNPLVVDGAFGPHSVLELPGYAPPAWLEVQPVESRSERLVVADTPVGDVEVDVWSPADTPRGAALPLLLAHDGPELAAYAALSHYVGASIAEGTLPPMRLALLAPGERNARYAADAGYAAALTHVLRSVRGAFPVRRRPVLMGASLGALAALHAEWQHPGTFGGLFLASGSFFTADTDPQERDFARFAAVSRFVTRVQQATRAPSRPAVVMTCGSMEENVHNNRVMARRLAALGTLHRYVEHPDVHNYTAWRDVLDPHLTALLTRTWGSTGGA